MSNLKFISTGIETLDKLLSGDDPSSKIIERGIPEGSILLIRGEPGSGKTTLAMQILSKYLFKRRNNSDDNYPSAIFFSYEENSDILLDNDKGRLRKFNFFKDLKFKDIKDKVDGIELICSSLYYNKWTNPQLLCISGDDFKKSIENKIPKEKKIKKVITEFAKGIEEGKYVSTSISSGFILIKSLLDKISGKSSDLEKSFGVDLIIVDSINSYLNLVQNIFTNISPRLVLNNLCSLLKNQFGSENCTLILTGDHHYHPSELAQTIKESFYCDVELVLRPEPIRVPVNYEPTIQNPIGYNLNALIKEDATNIESRSFCRVTKSRRSSNQSRRCTYDILNEQGLVFYDTYPGDGKIVLFAENVKQQQAWKSFFDLDIPESYPSLRYEVFDRMSMQTVYEGQRRLRNIPLKTDMYLSSFDCYWVGWYRYSKLKCDIDTILSDLILPGIRDKIENKKYANLVNSIVKIFAESKTLISARCLGNKDVNKLIRLIKPYIQNNTNVEENIKHMFSEEAENEFASTFSSFLRPIPFSKLKLCGEQSSLILPELINARKILSEKRITGEYKLNSKILKNYPDSWLAIPYDANISLIVCRTDLLRTSISKLDIKSVKSALYEVVIDELRLFNDKRAENDQKKEEELRLQYVYNVIHDDKKLIKDEDFDEEELLYAFCVKKVIDYCTHRIVNGVLPKTWDEMIVTAQLTGNKIAIELQSFNTYISTILEIIWNSGMPDFKINADYTIEDEESAIKIVKRAFNIIRKLFNSNVVNNYSTLETSFSIENATYIQKSNQDEQWLFARHWYSTLIDNLTAKDKSGNYIWCDGKKMDLEIMPLPVSISLLIDTLYSRIKDIKNRNTKENKKTRESLTKFFNCEHTYNCENINGCYKIEECIFKDMAYIEKLGKENLLSIDHHSSWGEWSFGLLTGSENVTLAIDLINNMMSSNKIIERAFSGACLPTVTKFYETYGDISCFNIPERPEINLPNTTFKELRETYFKNAVSRLNIYDFRHFAKILHSKVEIMRKSKDKLDDEKLEKIVRELFEEIKELNNSPILI